MLHSNIAYMPVKRIKLKPVYAVRWLILRIYVSSSQETYLSITSPGVTNVY